jgi:hypothetical protein
MKRLSIVSLALVALVGSAVGLSAAGGETFTGTAASGMYKRPQLLVDGKRYELKASDKADASVAEVLARFSKGDTGTYVVKGTRGTVHGVDGILIDGITPAKADPGTGAPAAAKRPGYKVYDQVVKATPPAMGEHKFRLVVPDGLAVVRGILVVGPYAGGDSRDYHEQVWYREFLNLHGFAFLGAKDFYMRDYKVMQAALKQLAIDTKHPELVNVPYAATGFSAGGGYQTLQPLLVLHGAEGKRLRGRIRRQASAVGGKAPRRRGGGGRDLYPAPRTELVPDSPLPNGGRPKAPRAGDCQGKVVRDRAGRGRGGIAIPPLAPLPSRRGAASRHPLA